MSQHPFRVSAAALAPWSLVLMASAAPSARAQSAAEPARIPSIVVTANPLGSDLFGLVAPVSVITGERLQLNMQPTLGEIVNTLPGVNSSYFGPNASRPVIRGLDGDRGRSMHIGRAPPRSTESKRKPGSPSVRPARDASTSSS